PLFERSNAQCRQSRSRTVDVGSRRWFGEQRDRDEILQATCSQGPSGIITIRQSNQTGADARLSDAADDNLSNSSLMQKSLDRNLAAIHADPSGCREFILADAKDADMAFGVGAPGQSPEQHAGELRFRTLAEYREQIRQIARSELVDIMLMSASTSDL